MWRFYLIATLIVVAIGSVVFAHRLGSLRDFNVEGTPRPGQTPTNTRGDAAEAPRPARSFGADGPWVMSALPDCFDQQKSTIGPTDLVRTQIPPERERIAPGTRIVWNDCAIIVGANDVTVARGSDRLRVPPQARLYRSGTALVLVWTSSYGRTEIRTYTRSAGS